MCPLEVLYARMETATESGERSEVLHCVIIPVGKSSLISVTYGQIAMVTLSCLAHIFKVKIIPNNNTKLQIVCLIVL